MSNPVVQIFVDAVCTQCGRRFGFSGTINEALDAKCPNCRPKRKRVAIVGAREYPLLSKVDLIVEELPDGTTVVSGGAPGVDKYAATKAKARGLYVIEIPVTEAEWYELGKKAGPMRNTEIVEACDELIAFWDGKVDGSGTLDSIKKAQKAGKLKAVYNRLGHDITGQFDTGARLFE